MAGLSLLLAGMVTLCVRTVDDEGYLRGRTAMFNTHGASMALSRLPYTHRGACIPGRQGKSLHAQVCLAKSSLCSHDRIITIWADQAEWYRKKCSPACLNHADACLDYAKGLQNFRRWMQWLAEMSRPYGNP